MLTQMAKESGIDTPTADDLVRIDRARKGKRLSNEEWTSKADPEAGIARLKDGRTDLAYKHTSDITVNTASGELTVHRTGADRWRVSLVETGLSTMAGGRLKRVCDLIGNSDFCMTYGDGIASIDITALLAFHRAHGRLATVTAVRPSGRFGALEITDDRVFAFIEKPSGDNGYINGGFFILPPKLLDYIEGDETVWEQEPMQALARAGQVAAFRHNGFWQPMDTLHEKKLLEAP